MRRHLFIALALLGLFSAPKEAAAADSTVSAMTAASALGGTELLYAVQAGADRKATPVQMAAYIYGLASGDCTISGVGAVVCTKTNGTNFGALATVTPGTGVATALGVNIGSAGAPVLFNGAGGTPSSMVGTNITGTAAGLTAGNVTTNANLTGAVTSTGNATSLGSFTAAQLLAAVATKTGTGVPVFATSPSIDSPTFTTTATFSFLAGGGTQCVQVNNSGVPSGTGAVCGGSGASGANPTATAGPTAVNGVASTFLRSDGAPAIQLGTAAQKGIVQVDGTTIVASSGVISAGGIALNLQTGANYPIVAGDFGKLVQLSNASAQTPTLPIASTTGANWVTNVCNIGAGSQTITPTTSTIGGAASYLLRGGTAAAPNCVTIQSDGTNYNVAPYGSTQTVGTTTLALATGAISSATCTSAQTATVTGTASTDVPLLSFNGDPTAVTGYVPLTSGMLTIIAYPTTNTVNVKVCNNTTGSITPGAITLNIKVVR